MKKLLSLFLAILMLVSVTGALPFTAQAKTSRWVDMGFAEANIEKLKTYINSYGYVDSAGDRYFSSSYEASTETYYYYITYERNTDMLNFYATFGDGSYVNLYYTYYDMTPEVQVVFPSSGARATVTFDCTEYHYQDLVFTVTDSFGGMTYSDIQEMCNLQLQAAIGSWDACLIHYTPYALYSIGFNSLCSHNLTTSYEAATFSKDGIKTEYCYHCGYNTETDYASIGTVKLKSKTYTYTGKAIKPAVIVKDSNGKTISKSNYSVKYQSGRKLLGKYSVTVTFINGKYKGSKKLYFTIVPKSTAISKLKSGKNSFTVNWKKQTKQTSGYQVQYSLKSNFKKGSTVTVSGNKNTSAYVNGLKGGKKYYVRVRTYKTVKGKKYYSKWSAKKTVTPKK